jgi:hypothetical protein
MRWSSYERPPEESLFPRAPEGRDFYDWYFLRGKRRTGSEAARASHPLAVCPLLSCGSASPPTHRRSSAPQDRREPMRFPAAGTTLLLLAALIVIAVAPAQPAAAAEPYCPNRAHATPGEVPADLRPAFATTFQLDATSEGAFVRCVGRKVMGCYTGANLNCFKADRRRALPEATAWCHDHPGSQAIPMAATGHATIYDWSCEGRRAVTGKITAAVDPQGYEADNWKEIPNP